MTDDFNKKVAKGGLKGLLNKDEPEPTPPVRSHNSWDGNNYYDDVPNFRREPTWPARAPAYQSPQYELGHSVGAGQGSGNVLFSEERNFAVLGDQECRRVLNLIVEDLRTSLKRYGMHWGFAKDDQMRNRMSDILFCGNMKIRNARGTAITICNEDQILELKGRVVPDTDTDTDVGDKPREEIYKEAKEAILRAWTMPHKRKLDTLLTNHGVELDDIMWAVKVGKGNTIGMKAIRTAIQAQEDKTNPNKPDFDVDKPFDMVHGNGE